MSPMRKITWSMRGIMSQHERRGVLERFQAGIAVWGIWRVAEWKLKDTGMPMGVTPACLKKVRTRPFFL